MQRGLTRVYHCACKHYIIPVDYEAQVCMGYPKFAESMHEFLNSLSLYMWEDHGKPFLFRDGWVGVPKFWPSS